jgi:hypothetical protein
MNLTTITKAEATQLRKVAQQARDVSEQAQWEQAVALHRIRYSGYSSGDECVAPIYELWGYEDWYSYVELEAGMHVGKANRWVATAHFFTVRMEGSWNKRVLSMTKMHALAQSAKVTDKNLNHWLSKAATMTPCQLEHELLGRAHHTRRMTFSLTDTQSTMVREALDLMMETGEYENRGAALVALVQGRRGRVRAA